MSRYSWKEMPSSYAASHFNIEDLKKDRRFIVIDSLKRKEYVFPIIEKKKDKYGISYNKLIFEEELLNMEFIQWAICTSPDFYQYVPRKFLGKYLLEYVVDNYMFPEIFKDEFDNILRKYMCPYLWVSAYKHNKEVVRYIPKYELTPKMIEDATSLKNFVRLEIADLLSPEQFKKIYFNCDNEHKLEWIQTKPNMRFYVTLSDENVNRLVSKEIAEDILSIDARTVCHVPNEFISENDAKKAMDTNIEYIEFVPPKYQTQEYQDRLVKKSPAKISLIDSTALTDQTIYTALTIKPTILGNVPKERRTKEICDFAIIKYPHSLKYVPDNIKTKEMCLYAVRLHPYLIKYVPIDILTESFLKSLGDGSSDIPETCIEYVNECLKINRKLKEDGIILEEDIIPTLELDSNKEYFNIRLNSLNGLVSNKVLKLLSGYGINTVGDLLTKAQDKDFYLIIIRQTLPVYKEINCLIKLLKCKYLDIDPKINIDSSVPIEELLEDFGLGNRIANCFIKAGYKSEGFIELIKDERKEITSLYINQIGFMSLKEIIAKASIVLDYYDRHPKQTNESKLVYEKK